MNHEMHHGEVAIVRTMRQYGTSETNSSGVEGTKATYPPSTSASESGSRRVGSGGSGG